VLRDLAEITDWMNSVCVSALVIGTPEKRVDAAPKASVCFLGGTREIFGGLSEDLLGGTENAQDTNVQGAGIIPKLCPMERAGMERMGRNKTHRSDRDTDQERQKFGIDENSSLAVHGRVNETSASLGLS